MKIPPRSKYFEVVYWPDGWFPSFPQTEPSSTSTTPTNTPTSQSPPPPFSPYMGQTHSVNYTNQIVPQIIVIPPTRPPSPIPHQDYNGPYSAPLSSSPPASQPEQISNKTSREKKRGDKLFQPGVGQKAHVPCAHCTNNPEGCCVPTNGYVKLYNSLKCAKCIKQKLKCCFNINNPGIDYSPDVLEAIRAKEEKKLASRAKAMETNRKKQEMALAGPSGSQTTIPSGAGTSPDPPVSSSYTKSFTAVNHRPAPQAQPPKKKRRARKSKAVDS
ncbi:hypothetical protein F4781DRAFT_436092 [Annulohypoxylon bovei var. microspora]|nr:hypothetical protein F4781DRAFT_436092 [Annulohypoxylon bovei var. microspora]